MTGTRFFTNAQCKEDSVKVPFFDNESCCAEVEPVPPVSCIPLDPFTLCNPSFEGTPVFNNGNDFDPNMQCWRQFANTTPDILPVQGFITVPANNGLTYVGLASGGLPPDTYLPGEGIWQQLPFVLRTDLTYFFNIDIIELTDQIWSPGFGYGVLEVWGGNTNGQMDELLWTSPVINQGTVWIPFLVTFTPVLATHTYLFFRFSRTAGTSCYIGIDNMSEIQTICVEQS